MKKMNWKALLFWVGVALLIADLVTYYSQIMIYFTTLGQVLLVVSIILIIVSGFVKTK